MKIIILSFIASLFLIGCCENNNKNRKCNETFCENGIVKINVCKKYESVAQPVVDPNTQKVIMCEESK